MINLSDKSYWDKEWAAEDREDYHGFLFGDLAQRYLPRGGTYFEVGCAPGSNMAFFHHCLGYSSVKGIDYAAATVTRKYLDAHGVVGYQVYNQDFLNFTTEEQFTVVASFGFIEHFLETEKIIALHQCLVAPGGYLIIELPNLRYLNWLCYRCLRPNVLAMHNLKIMSTTQLREEVSRSGDFEILYADYFKSCFLSFNAQNLELTAFPGLRSVLLAGKWLLKLFGLENVPNRFASPYIVLIAHRKAGASATRLSQSTG